jgi:hypothetical protein
VQDQDANGDISRGRDFRVSEELIVAGVVDPRPVAGSQIAADITDARYNTRRRFRYAVQARSTHRALEKFVQRTGGGEDRPGRNRGDDSKEQRLNGKFPTLFAREITSG